MRRAAIAAVRRDPEASAFDYMQHIINQAYIDALVSSGMMPVIIPVLSPDMAHDALLGCDGLLLPGGGDVDPSLYGEEDRHCGRTDRLIRPTPIRIWASTAPARYPILSINPADRRSTSSWMLKLTVVSRVMRSSDREKVDWKVKNNSGTKLLTMACEMYPR